jgi:thioredoxin-related protein
MKLLLGIIFFLTTSFISSSADWGHSLKDALQIAKKDHKFILLNFSGSDWCGPCIKLHKEVFVLPEFISVANEKLLLVNADFPRYKKNQLAPALQQQNEALAEKYNARGIFPYTILLNEDGNQIKDWEGFPSAPADFISEIQEAINNQHP